MPRQIESKAAAQAREKADRDRAAALRVQHVRRVLDLTVAGISTVQIAAELGLTETAVAALLKEGLRYGNLDSGKVAAARAIEAARIDRIWGTIYAHWSHITAPRTSTNAQGQTITLPGPVETDVSMALLKWSEHRAKVLGLVDPNLLHAEVASHEGGDSAWSAERVRVIADDPELLEQYLKIENVVRERLAAKGIGFVEPEPTADDFMSID